MEDIYIYIFHLPCSCERLSSSLYLLICHNEEGKVLYNEIIKQRIQTHQNIIPPLIWGDDDLEIWCDIHIKTVPSVKHNKPDIGIWEKDSELCKIIDVCVPLDENVHIQEKTKNDLYIRLEDYHICTLITNTKLLGATGLITASLVNNMKV